MRACGSQTCGSRWWNWAGPCLPVPEEAGGIGMSAAAVAGLVEEVGLAAFPCPLVATLNTTYVLNACGAGGEAALGEIGRWSRCQPGDHQLRRVMERGR